MKGDGKDELGFKGDKSFKHSVRVIMPKLFFFIFYEKKSNAKGGN